MLISGGSLLYDYDYDDYACKMLPYECIDKKKEKKEKEYAIFFTIPTSSTINTRAFVNGATPTIIDS